jgi:oligopeptidase B
MKTPQARIEAKELNTHNHVRTDNYYWLRDDKRENEEIIDYLNQENQYTQETLAPLADFQKSLFEEMKGRIKEQDESVPYKMSDYWYYVRYEEGAEHPILCRKKDSLEGNEEVVLNANELAKGHSYYQLAGSNISSEQNIVAFCEDLTGRRQYNVRFKNLETGEFYPETLTNTGGSMTWASDNQTLFYVLNDKETLRAYQVYRHTLGTEQKDDVLIYEEKDETFYLDLEKSKSKKYIFMTSNSTLSSEIQYLESDKPNGEFKLFLKREEKHEYFVEHFEDKFYIVSNWDAMNFRLMSVPIAQSQDKTAWKEVIAHRNDVLLDGLDIFKDYLVITERKEGLIHLRVIEWKTQKEYYVAFEDAAYVVGTTQNLNFDTKILRYSYSSLTTPNSTFDFRMDTKEKTLLKQKEVLGDFEAANYRSERVYATAKDGVKVPVSLVYHKNTALDGSAPLFVYAYGSYGISIDAYFNSTRLSLLNRGFVFAIAHIRGGEEMGRQWYEDGKLLKKQNTFTDFIACTEHLIAENYGDKNKVFANGGSAGGLLMGAIANMKPELFKGILAAVPFVDVVTTMLDESIPLTTFEYDEWGNPNEKKFYDYMLSYSPYDNVKAQNYPNMYVASGLHDSQVQYWEPTKWVAKLRATKTDDNTLLLHTNMEAGHSGASGRFARIKDIAREYIFMFYLLDINS